MRRVLSPLLLTSALLSLTACGGSSVRQKSAASPRTETVFDLASPSVVAILNDDRAVREEEAKRSLLEMGVESTSAPKTIVDVSLRKEPMPHGTGFFIEGGLVVTAAHVILAPDTLRITTRTGKTVPAELLHIDEVRDVAVLRPKEPLTGVPPLKLAVKNPNPGRTVWALGHTGNGLWALSWGISEGITSGTVDMLGAKLTLFDAPVYPGFSGGPVVMMDDGKPVVVGVNHAILFTGGVTPVASISSASSVEDLRDALAKKPAALEPALAAYAKTHLGRPRAELFITRNLSVHKDPQMLTTAAIVGNQKTVETGADDHARIPTVAMLFGLPKGKHTVTFDVASPSAEPVATLTRPIEVSGAERVAFASADLRFDPKQAGRFEVVAKVDGKSVGRTDVWVEDPDDDDQPVDDDDAGESEDGEPRVDVVVASYGTEQPFALAGIRAAWVEWRYPRRVGFTWFARGSRGFTGQNVAISAFVLDETGKIVGRGVGCVKPELRPEHTWTCAGSGGTPLLAREGRYDVVFTLNDRPVGVWPMEAMVRTGAGASAMDRWMGELKKQHALKKKPR